MSCSLSLTDCAQTTARRRAQREAHRNTVEAAGQLDAHRTVFQGLVDSDEDDEEEESDAPSATASSTTATAAAAAAASAERRTPTNASRANTKSPMRSPVRSPVPRSRLSAAAVALAAAPVAAPLVPVAASTDAWDDEDSATAQQRAAAQARASQGVWVCDSCTLENDATARCCEACGLSKGEWSVAA
jgi:hypothetical protein